MENNIYKVKDLYEASLLYCKKLPLIRLEWVQEKCFFVFKDKRECESLSSKFWDGNLEVNAREYADSIRKLKDRVFAHK